MPAAMDRATFRAYHLTEGLKLTSVLNLFPDKPFRASGTELVYRFGKDQFLIIYNFGSMVCFNLDAHREDQALTVLRQFVAPRDEIVTSEEFVLEIGPRLNVEFRRVILDKPTFEKIQIISLVLAQSTALEYFENLANQALQQSGTISEVLEKQGKIGKKDSELVRFIGVCLNVKQKVISSTYLLDSPEPTWENQVLEQLYVQMADMFELRERYRTLEYKLKIVQETVEIIAELSRSRSVWYLEMTIVVLIAIEVILFIYQLAS
jgi:uncharacterized Rmd1/YagE family protein